jgi:hypothetical protein
LIPLANPVLVGSSFSLKFALRARAPLRLVARWPPPGTMPLYGPNAVSHNMPKDIYAILPSAKISGSPSGSPYPVVWSRSIPGQQARTQPASGVGWRGKARATSHGQHLCRSWGSRPRGLGVALRKLWEYRELAYFLVWRDIKVRYKHIVFGAARTTIEPCRRLSWQCSWAAWRGCRPTAFPTRSSPMPRSRLGALRKCVGILLIMMAGHGECRRGLPSGPPNTGSAPGLVVADDAKLRQSV